MGNCYTVGPNEALVRSGGWVWAWAFVTDVQALTLEVMTLNPKCDMVETAQGVAVTVTGVCQVKIMTEPELLKTACEQFSWKKHQTN
ncbi:Flotillin-2 [Desmophyllum pertusum]|uniref:Flotillin-2 n=1 Tax=Desmophyllum pertusum TaxID=174260 RepID=A0A9X0CGK0_9CNID|nr:Flotillin-2 [Desmophyllum pertusum]